MIDSGDVNWPVVAFRYNKKGSSPDYNVVTMKLLSQFDESGEKPEPKWMQFGIRTNSGSSFTCTIEAQQHYKTWQ